LLCLSWSTEDTATTSWPVLAHSQAGGSGELLRDEQIFLAHKAANPAQYPPSDAILKRYPKQKALVDKYPPTKVQLQMYGACPTPLSTVG
jgi:hypothetical protein